MSTPSEEPTLHELVSRLAELEQAHARLQEELTHVRAERAPAAEEQASAQTHTRPERSSRRKVLTTGLGVAAATVGAGALLELSSGTASAAPTPKPGDFASSTAGTPAVRATGSSGADGVDAFSNTAGAPAVKASGTNGAHGVDASSDSGIGVSATSTSGTGIFAQSGSADAIHAVGGGGSKSALFAEGGTGFGVFGVTSSSAGVLGSGTGGGTGSGTGVFGDSFGGIGVSGFSTNGAGVRGQSGSGIGLHAVGGGASLGTLPSGITATAVFAEGGPNPGLIASSSSSDGVFAQSSTGNGVHGTSTSGTGIFAQSGSSNAIHAKGGGTGVSALFAEGGTGFGVFANSTSSDGVRGSCINGSGNGVTGISVGPTSSGNGVTGISDFGDGVRGSSQGSGNGVTGSSVAPFGTGNGVFGTSTSGDGVFGTSTSGNGVHGKSSTGLAGFFEGNVTVTGTLTKPAGSFKIDHPLDPAHKYLSHSFVESPDMKNIYDGVVALDANGEAEVTLPTWFDTLNTDFRYQLTCLGGYAPVYIAEKIRGNRFKIAGGPAGMEVSWQVSGIRQDAWANAYRIPVEEDKPAEEQGFYLHPELYGQPERRAGALL